MHAGRFAGLLLAALLAASLEDAVDARRTLNKCCAPNEHLYFSMDSGYYTCETEREKADRDEAISNDSNVEEAVDDGDEYHTATARDDVLGVGANSTNELAIIPVTRNNISSAAGDTGNPSAFTERFQEVLRMQSLAEDDVVADVFPPCYQDAPDGYDYRFNKGLRLRTTPDTVFLLTPGKHEFDSRLWCLDLDHEDDVLAVVCPCLDADKPCVRKCCPDGEVFEEESSQCVASNLKPWMPATNASFYKLSNNIPTCEYSSIERFHQDELSLLPDGSIKGRNIDGRPEVYPPGRFCVDATNSSNTTDADGDLLVLFCIETDALSDAVTIFKGVVTLLGALALLVTVVLTAIFPEMRENIHGKMALCHNASLLVAFAAIGATQVAGNRMDGVTCKVLSFVMQYTLLAAFFWLNVMCVEVSWVFSALRPVKKIIAGYVDSKFLWYSLYAWGTTSLISVITMLVEFVPGAQLKPRFGEANCFFHGDDKIPQLLFLFGPMAILLAINIGLFVFTATKIITHRRQTSILKTNDSKTNNRNKQNLILYVKLFTLMGVTWIFEIVSWAVGGKNYYWLVIDCVNLLRGVFIFFIFCCKRSVLELVRARLGCAPAQEGSQSSAATKSTVGSNEAHEMTDTSSPAKGATDLR